MALIERVSTTEQTSAVPDGAYVETYREHGMWKNRRYDCTLPFSIGRSREQQIAVGAEVARWNQVRHIIRE
jgi:hypothetical protein